MMDTIAVMSGGIGIVGFILMLIVAVGTGSWVPFLAGTVFLVVMVGWKHLVNNLGQKKTLQDTASIIKNEEGKVRGDKLGEYISQYEGGRELYDGSDKYIRVLKHLLTMSGVHGIHDYRPRKFQLFEPYGIFLMEIEQDSKWDRDEPIYAMLCVSGPHAWEHIGNIKAYDWRHAVQYLLELGQTGMIPAKLQTITPFMNDVLKRQMSMYRGD